MHRKTNICYNIAREYSPNQLHSASVLHIPTEHADDVNKLYLEFL